MKWCITLKPDKALRAQLNAIQQQGADMSAAVDRMRDEVAEIKTVVGSAKALLESISQQLRDLKDDPAAIEALADDLDAARAELASAVADNTPPAA